MALRSPDGGRQFLSNHIEAKSMMKRQQNKPTVQYLIECRLPGGGEVVNRFTIEQVESGRGKGGVDTQNYNTVQHHLNALSEKTGLECHIVLWGDVEDRSGWLAGGSLRQVGSR